MDRSPSSSSSHSTRPRSTSPYDRHIRRLDQSKFDRPVSPSSSNRSTSSYQSQLEQTLLTNSSLKQYTHQRNERAVRSKPPPTRRKCEPLRSFTVRGWDDNYYSNLLDWSHNNFLCAGSGGQLSFYNMGLHDSLEEATPRKYRLSRRQNFCSLRFAPASTKIAVGYNDGLLQIYDYYRERTILQRNAHASRIAALDWQNTLIFTGSKDKYIKATDCRSEHDGPILVQKHDQQICGVRSNGHLLASGGNDNRVLIYDLRRTDQVLDQYTHDAAVKALTWMGATLISGGGTADKAIKFWKDAVEVAKQIDTGSQICGLIASPTTPELISCQGFSLNQIIIWSLEGKRMQTIHGHKSRVIYSTLSPDGEFLATGAGDQCLKVWRVFGKKPVREWNMPEIR